MKTNPFLNKITIFPVKSLDGMELQKAMITEGGCLLHDREFAMSDEEGNFIIGKTNSLVYTLRCEVNFENKIISFKQQNENSWHKFNLENEIPAIQSFLSDNFGKKVILHQNKTGRFMDIPDISGVTILSKSSLQSITEWYDNINLDQTRKRFRATIEVDGVSAFWEDHLFSSAGKGIEFKIGDVTMFGMSPRARCIVPTHNPETGEIVHAFAKTFASHRAAAQPEWSTLNEYGHHYHLTVNCYVPETEIGKWIEVGNEVKIIGEKIFYE